MTAQVRVRVSRIFTSAFKSVAAMYLLGGVKWVTGEFSGNPDILWASATASKTVHRFFIYPRISTQHLTI